MFFKRQAKVIKITMNHAQFEMLLGVLSHVGHEADKLQDPPPHYVNAIDLEDDILAAVDKFDKKMVAIGNTAGFVIA